MEVSFKKFCIFFLVHPGRSPGIEMCLSAPGIYNVNNLIFESHINDVVYTLWFSQVGVLALKYA